MEKKVVWIVLGLFLFGATALFAEEPVKKENTFKRIAAMEKRGIVNLATSPGELFYTLKAEKKEYPRAWPATYLPRLMLHAGTRVASGVYDIAILPWYVQLLNDDAPMTRHFDMPDYVWEKI